MAGVSPSTLRLWEGHGLIEPIRTSSGQRLYDQSLLERLKMIIWLRTEKGLNPAAIRETLKAQAPVEELRDEGESDEDLEHFQDKWNPVFRAEMHENAPVSDDRDGLPIGLKLRRLRREAGKTLEMVAHATGIAVSLLSTFERTSQGLSFTALHELVKYFDTTLAVLSGQEEHDKGESLIRAGRWSTWPASSSGVTVQVLAEGKNQMECHRFHLAPGASSEGAYQHPGEEFIHILSGSLEIVLDGDQFFVLNAGDSFYFESKRPHSWRNSFDGETIAIWVNTPPTF